MLFPQNPFGFSKRSIKTNYLSELAALQANKSRSYTQIKQGGGDNNYQEANLGSIQLIRERLSGAVRIHAAPPKQFLPLAAPLPSTNSFRFCGREREENTLLRATGDEWDICSDNNLEYVGLVVEYDSLNLHHQYLHQRELPPSWLTSKSAKTSPEVLNQYTAGIQYLFKLISNTENLFQSPTTCRFIANAASQMALKALSHPLHENDKPIHYSRRIKGVYRVVDYLQSFASELPSIPDLCVVAELSERSLEYGFREYLGITPVKYLKIIRLNGVRETLLTNKTSLLVSDAALQWGFLELGYFAADYQKLFGELPSQTLKQR